MIRLTDLTVKLGLDWGSSKPGCVLWGVALPDAHAHIFDEFKFGGKQKLAVKECAEAIREKTLGDWKMRQMPRIYCDPALKIKTGQIGEDFIQTFGRHKVVLTPVSNNRIVGWQRVHEALKDDPDTGTAWLTVHPRCKYLIRTIPAQVQDEHELEDLDTDGDDHACDALRYLLMGGLRPGSKAVVVESYQPNTWGWWRKYHETRDTQTGVLA